MAEQINKTQEQRRIISGRMLLLCMSGLLINIIFAHLARIMALPLYLDNIGSALAAALGGYIPGIIVGFLTNLINGIWDYSSIYYGSLTILIAMASAWFAGKKYYSFQKPWRLLAVIAVFALIGGGLGSVLTWFLYGFSFASGISAPLALRLFSGGIANKFLAQLSADLLVDLADKGITVFIVALSFSILPASLRESLYSAGWQVLPKVIPAAAAIDTPGAGFRSGGISGICQIVCAIQIPAPFIHVAMHVIQGPRGSERNRRSPLWSGGAVPGDALSIDGISRG